MAFPPSTESFSFLGSLSLFAHPSGARAYTAYWHTSHSFPVYRDGPGWLLRLHPQWQKKIGLLHSIIKGFPNVFA